jgi:hypothetical protein
MEEFRLKINRMNYLNINKEKKKKEWEMMKKLIRKINLRKK